MESYLRCSLYSLHGLVLSPTSTVVSDNCPCFTSDGISYCTSHPMTNSSIFRCKTSIFVNISSFYLLSVLFLAATVFAGPLPTTDFCETNLCAKALLKHPALSQSFCQKYEKNSRYPWHPSQSELLVRPPIPNHPLYAAACFDEDYVDGLLKPCDCVPR